MDELGLVGNWVEQIYSGNTSFDGSDVDRDYEVNHPDLYGMRAILSKNKNHDKYENAFMWVLDTLNFISGGFQSGRDTKISRLEFFLSGYDSCADDNRYIDFVLHESKGRFPKKKIEQIICNKDEVKRLHEGMKWILLTQKYVLSKL